MLTIACIGICYGAQLTAKEFGGKVGKSNKREYGRAKLLKTADDVLLKGVSNNSQVWMSHSDSINKLPKVLNCLQQQKAFLLLHLKNMENGTHALYGLQFHPEVYHSTEGKKILKNFLVNICGCKQDWTPASFIHETVEQLKKQIGDAQVIMALSGGVDSTVAATLISKAIGESLYGIFVDNGVLRKNEFETCTQHL